MTSAGGNRKDYYPDLFSADAIPAPTPWTSDFVVRSLRRRLWKAFVEDDQVSALRAYQANFQDFRQWLQDEEDSLQAEHERQEKLRENQGKKDKHGFAIKRKGQKNTTTASGNDNGGGSGSRSLRMSWIGNGTRANQDETRPEHDLLLESEKKKDELRQLFGGDSILETRMDPSDRFLADDMLSPHDKYEHPPLEKLPDLGKFEAEQQALALQRQLQRRPRGPRQAFRMIVLRRENSDGETPAPHVLTPATSSDDSLLQEDIYMTTPLHEASRLGAADFVRFLLAKGGDPNIKNGQGRTTLHMAAGGWTKEEEASAKARTKNLNCDNTTTKSVLESTSAVELSDIESAPIGIRAMKLPFKLLELMHKDVSASTGGNASKKKKKNKNDRGLIGRLFGNNEDDAAAILNANPEDLAGQQLNNSPSSDRFITLVTERMDTFLAVMSWIDQSTGTGPSLNAVDAVGRTALHYAAETGRSDICMAILSNFEAMLTIVDDLGARTPCELAAANNHPKLAAQLEARALLYIDPYGYDDDMMQDLMRSTSSDEMAVPFSWFMTTDLHWCTAERTKRVNDVRSSFLLALARYDGSETAIDVPTKDAEVRSDSGSENEEGIKSKPGNGVRLHVASVGDEHVERLLTFHKWDVSNAVKAIRRDPIKALKDASIPIPQNLPKGCKSEDRLCPICYEDDIDNENWIHLSGCNHGFCKDCMVGYLRDCALSKAPSFAIGCPHHNCQSIFKKCDIDYVLEHSSSVLSRISEATTEHFITTARDFKFCPHPGCNGIVHRLSQSNFERKGIDVNLIDYTGATCVAVSGSSKPDEPCVVTYEGVKDARYTSCSLQPMRSHRFCFACSEQIHWPITCERLNDWKEKVKEEIGDVDKNDETSDYNELAQKLWIKANTRPCPMCNVPIEKHDGCNHMTCTNPSCLHEFCWICRKDWKLHGSTTGGFYRCNIWKEEDSQPVTAQPSPTNRNVTTETGTDDEGYGTAIYSAREAWKKKQEMNRFLHHYTRWEAHEASAVLERKMADSACTRLAPVVEAAIDFNGSPTFDFDGQGLSFIHAAFIELQECRSLLRHSYAYSFFRYPSSSGRRSGSYHLNSFHKEKRQFERYQYELETLTEQMSDIVARSHLRATQVQIQHLTARTADMRKGFTILMFNILSEEEKDKKNRDLSDLSRADNGGHLRPPASSLAEYFLQHRLAQEGRNPITSQEEIARRADDDVELAMDAFAMNLERRRRTAVEDDASGDNDAPVQMWACRLCTFMNSEGERCSMCGTRRGA